MQTRNQRVESRPFVACAKMSLAIPSHVGSAQKEVVPTVKWELSWRAVPLCGSPYAKRITCEDSSGP